MLKSIERVSSSSSRRVGHLVTRLCAVVQGRLTYKRNVG
jgi:hypothetical protein